MSYIVHPTVGKPFPVDGYPTFDPDGTLHLSGDTLEPGQWRSVKVESEAERDLTGMGISSSGSASRGGDGAPMPHRGRGKRTSDYEQPRS